MLTQKSAGFILYVCCCFAPSIVAATPIVDLTYARYQGVPTLDTVNNATITQFLAIRYAAAPTGRSSKSSFTLIIPYQCWTGSQRFREPQLPLYTPGVQLANKHPPECLQAKGGTAPKTPFRNADSSLIRRLETRVDSGLSAGSEDCLFLKYNLHVN